MVAGDASHPRPRRGRSRRATAWLAFLSACVAFAVIKPLHDRHWRAATARHQVALLGEAVDAITLRWTIGEYLAARDGAPAEAIEAALGLPPGRLNSASGSEIVRLTVDGVEMRLAGSKDRTIVAGARAGAGAGADLMPLDCTGWQISLTFYDGWFRNADVTPSTTPLASPPGDTIHRALHWFTRGVRFLTPVVWIGSLLAAETGRTARRARFGEAATAAAIASFVAWAVDFPRGTAWIAASGLAALVAARMTLRFRRDERGIRDGKCARCGYDLTGNESGICPECGTPTPAAQRRRRPARAGERGETLTHVIDDSAAVTDSSARSHPA